jgi:hypothetical protein
MSGDVIILPITTRTPRSDALAVELTGNEKRVCGLDAGVSSWVIVSEFNADTWPNADIAPAGASGRSHFGLAPPGLLRRIFRVLERQVGKEKSSE